MSKDVSRRDFLKGGALVGASAAIGTLAACSPNEPGGGGETGGNATEATSTGRWSWSVPPAPIPDDQISATYDCDVCVVGAGVAGIPASLYAAEKGLKVMVLQKDPAIAVNGQAMGAWNHPFGDDAGIVWDTNLSVQKYATVSNGKVNLKLFRQYVEHSGEALDYITKFVTDPPRNISAMGGGPGYEHLSCNFLIDGDFLTRYTGWRQFNTNMALKAEEFGATYLYSTPAEQLVTDSSGAVIGVIGKTDSGDYVKVNAQNVILCTGDVGCSEEMREAFFPITVGRPDLHTSPCNTGDGLKMGLWVGAAMDHAPAGLQLHFDPSPLSFPAPPNSAAPWLHVNIRGERFTNENVGYQALATAVSSQPEYRAYQIIDTHYNENLDHYTNGFRRGSVEVFEQCVSEGSILAADTLEELASKAGFPTDAFVATVTRYNELVDKGADDDYGSDIIQYNGIKDPPFYAIQRMPGLLVAGVGLTCNEFGQVMGTDFEPIKGLYAAGNNMGSYYGYDYPVEGFGGNTIGHSITWGILDVMHIMGTFGDKIE